jgi:stage II sporulation protein GA (sporulation sigma-E factor processing peptidase)
MAFLAFGYKNLSAYLKASGTLFGVTCLYAGVMIAVWRIFKPSGMVINNSVIYFNISPLILICFTVAFYLLFTILLNIFSATAKNAERCQITLSADNTTVNCEAIVDTGNSVVDIFGKSEVIIADRSVYYSLFGNLNVNTDDNLKKRYRVIPCSTVTGADTLEGYRCDKADIKTDTCIYMDYGSEEIFNHHSTAEALISSAQMLLTKRVNLAMRIVPGGTHSEASWEKQIPIFMDCLGL